MKMAVLDAASRSPLLRSLEKVMLSQPHTVRGVYTFPVMEIAH
jgi:hypothetical protein